MLATPTKQTHTPRKENRKKETQGKGKNVKTQEMTGCTAVALAG